MRAFASAALVSLSLLTAACAPVTGRARFASAESGLSLDRVVLYRNGVGYFERKGEVDGNILRIKVRKDQINDLLKSLTIVDRKTGQAVSVSMPLDPDTWANAALATLAPNHGSLAQVLDLLRGVDVSLDTTKGSVDGRIVMVEQISEEPDPDRRGARGDGPTFGNDHKVTLMDDDELRIVRLSKVKGVTLKDGDLAMQFHRRLDAAAGEGMFQQVEVAIRLAGAEDHDLVVSYVVEAPMWKPTYRVVLPEGGKGEALLQAWAVVDNVSGEDWSNVKLSLTAGAPIAFRYDMHSPRRVFRPDVSGRIHSKRARVAMGETSFDGEDEADEAELAATGGGKKDRWNRKPRPPAAAPAEEPMSGGDAFGPRDKRKRKVAKKAYGRSASRTAEAREKNEYSGYDMDDEPAFDAETLRRSTRAQTKARHASGLTRYDIQNPVTVPDGSATMVALINASVVGEEVFMYDPKGGGGPGYEQNPFRVVRFKNSTPFVLESGPISIYSGGSFVGEGISEAVGANTSATIPFAVEPSIMVTKEQPSMPQQLRLLKIVRGVVHAERFYRTKTVWNVKAQNMNDGFKLLIRHPRLGGTYKLKDKPEGLEELKDAYLVPLSVPKGKKSGSVTIVEQTPSKVTVRVQDGDFLGMLKRALVADNFSAEERAQLEPLVALRQEIGKIDSEIRSLESQEQVLNRRLSQHRRNQLALKDNKSPEAAKMRNDLAKQIGVLTKQGDALGVEIVKLQQQRQTKVVQLEQKLATLTIGGKGK